LVFSIVMRIALAALKNEPTGAHNDSLQTDKSVNYFVNQFT